jgi:hypothetical protein
MSSRKVRYGQLDEYLTSLGYELEEFPTHVIYRKKGYRLPIILPKTSKTQEVWPPHLTAVEGILMLDGVIGPGHFILSANHKSRAPKRKVSRVKVPKVKAPKRNHG